MISFFGDAAFFRPELVVDLPKPGYGHCNLEAPILHPGEYPHTLKVGPRLSQGLGLAQHRFFSNFSFGLANNHTMDFGYAGLTSTLRALNPSESSGAGENSMEAQRPILLEIDGVKIGIIVCSDRFFGAAGRYHPGIAVIDAQNDWVTETIIDLRAKGVVPVISFHGGIEDYPLPSPVLRSLFRKWIDSGGELVVAHHPHVPLPFEIYKNKYIFYGLGNFLVDPKKWGSKNSLELVSIRVDALPNFPSAELRISYSLVEVSDTRYPDNLLVTEVNRVKSESILDFFDLTVNIMSSDRDYLSVYDFLAERYVREFATRQLSLGAIGLHFPAILKTFAKSGINKLSRKLHEGFGPHLIDVFGPQVTSDFALRGIARVFDQDWETSSKLPHNWLSQYHRVSRSEVE